MMLCLKVWNFREYTLSVICSLNVFGSNFLRSQEALCAPSGVCGEKEQ